MTDWFISEMRLSLSRPDPVGRLAARHVGRQKTPSCMVMQYVVILGVGRA